MDNTQESNSQDQPQKHPIRIFYHIACINNWRSVVRDQFMKIIFSGLYHKTDTIHCFMVIPPYESSEDYTAYVQRFGNKIRIEQTVSTTDPSGCDEWFTLGQMRSYIDPEDRVLYLHTKGVTRFHRPEMFPNVEDWRDLMDYHLIHRHNECLDTLRTIDVVGINYMGGHPPHYSGNYWWCTGKHFLSLPDTKHIEDYVMCTAKDGTVTNRTLFQSPFIGSASYHNPYPFKDYIDK